MKKLLLLSMMALLAMTLTNAAIAEETETINPWDEISDGSFNEEVIAEEVITEEVTVDVDEPTLDEEVVE